MFQCIVPPRSEYGQKFQDMKGAFTEIRSQFEDHLECLDTRLEQQKKEISDIQDYFKRRAEIEKRYSKDLETLDKHMRNKHRDTLQNKDATSSVAILKELVKETRKTGRNHAILEEIFGTQIYGRCGTISSDISRVYKQCRDAGVEIQENILGVLFELHTKTKIYQTNKDNFEQAQKKLIEAEKDIAKLEKEIKPEKREKTKKYTNAQKVLKTRHVRHEDTHSLAIRSRIEYVLCIEAANAALKKYYKDDVSGLMDCMDLGFHHLLKNLLKIRTSAIDNLKASEQEDMEVMDLALGSLDSRKDKAKFLENHAVIFSLPEMFELTTNKALQTPPEEMDLLKGKIQEKIVKLRDLSDYTARVIEDAEAELLLIFHEKNYDMTSLFARENVDLKKEESEGVNNRLGLEELIIVNNKRLLLTNNRIEQEEAKYQNLKKSLVVQQFCPETLPRPKVKRRPNRMQTVGLPKIFGGSLDDYYEATGEKIPLVIESCIRTINLFGMRHQGIFRITGSHVDINKFEEAFENGEDPFACMMDGNHINSVSGVLKSYFRKLNEPLFSEAYFEQFMNITKIGENIEFVLRACEIIRQWSEPHIVVTRYLFSFLKDLSQYSEETQMDPWNIAICFGPNLCPIPEGKDLVQHTNLVNDLIKNFIIFCDDIFHDEIEGPLYVNTDGLENSNDENIQEEVIEEAIDDPPKPKPEKAVALYDYKAGTAKELSFSKGDQLLLFSKASDHWWMGSKDGVKGLIPAQYVEIQKKLEEIQEKQDSLKEKNQSENSMKPKEDESSTTFPGDEDFGIVLTKTLSFKSNRIMWENKTLDRPKKKTSNNSVTAPDLLQDLVETTHAKTPPGARSRSGSTISAGSMSPGKDVPDGIVALPEKPLGKVKPMTKVASEKLSDEKKEDFMDTAV